MTYKEKFLQTRDWKKRAIIINLYHKIKCLKERKWNQRKTANYFDLSLGMISESIKIAENLDVVEGCKDRKEALIRLIRVK